MAGLFQGQTDADQLDQQVGDVVPKGTGSTRRSVDLRLRLGCADAMSVWTALHIKVVFPKGSSMLELKTELSTPPENAWWGQKVLMRLCQPLTNKVHPLR